MVEARIPQIKNLRICNSGSTSKRLQPLRGAARAAAPQFFHLRDRRFHHGKAAASKCCQSCRSAFVFCGVLASTMLRQPLRGASRAAALDFSICGILASTTLRRPLQGAARSADPHFFYLRDPSLHYGKAAASKCCQSCSSAHVLCAGS